MIEFLKNSDFGLRPLKLDVRGIQPIGLFLGKKTNTLEVAVLSSSSKPSGGTLQKAFKTRKADRASPVLVVAIYSDGVSLCGTAGNEPPVYHTEDVSQVERLCEGALALPDRNAAVRFLADAMPSLETQLPGISNEGLLSLHELTHGTRSRSDWSEASNKAKNVLGKSNEKLVEALGFTTQRLDGLTKLLLANQDRTALAVLLNEDEVPEIGTGRFNNLSPVSYALTKADKERLPWVLMVQGDRVRLYNTNNIGVGRRGRTETYIECHPSLMSSKDVGLLWLLFSSDALKERGSINGILENSKRFAADIAVRLRERIYKTVVPQLAMGIAKARNLTNPSKDDMELTYEMALTALFRLLFIAYAEDRDLLPYNGNESYRKRSLKQKAIELADAASKEAPISAGYHHWTETVLLWDAISRGNKGWDVPAYNGTMLSSDAAVSKAGAALANIKLPNKVFEEALRGLLLTESTETPYAPVDFRALSVREFGTIYEGLLESELSLAEQDLTIDKKGVYLPASEADEIVVEAGEIYLHDRSGARKSSGSYYTPDFSVEHLLDSALEPALDEHLARMTTLSDADRTEQFFDFRVADIAMGSGHFLVAAIDHIERRFALWLEENPTPGVTRELEYLRKAAKKELGSLIDTVLIEDGQLLRRMIARRCIYGVDLNAITVQLARLSIWIHTFVPGLPLSLLDHNLVHGNALVGIGSLDEIRKKFDEGEGTPFAVDADNLLGQAAEPLKKLARLSDASIKDIESGRVLIDEAREKTQDTKALCDLITAQPVADDPRLKAYYFQDWEKLKTKVQNSDALRLAREILDPLSALHFPIAFPEVFLGRSQGFNVILGNPPWEKVKIEEHTFWAGKFPELRNLEQGEMEEKIQELRENRPDLVSELDAEKQKALYFRNMLHSSSAFIMGAGDPDLYQAFSWRFLGVLATKGHLGVVMPRSVLSAEGSANFRKKMFMHPHLVEATLLTNRARWIFDMEPRYTIALVCFAKNCEKQTGIRINGPFNSLMDFNDNISKSTTISFDELGSWSESCSVPMLPRFDSPEILRKLKFQDKFHLEGGDWMFHFDREMDATNDKHLMNRDKKESPKNWPVFKGSSFNLWEPDTGKRYRWAKPDPALEFIQKKRKRGWNSRKGKYSNFSEEYIEDMNTIAAKKPRIAFRDITCRTNRRTTIVALVPPKVFLTNKAPYLLRVRGDEKDEAFILGILSSIVLDWYSRRFVEITLNYFIFQEFPIPRPDRSNPLWQRVVELSGRLACPDDRFAGWAETVGVGCGPLDSDDKNDKIHELDAVVARLYDLTEPQITHVFETFHEGWDYGPRLNEVLKHYRAWGKKA